jgi:hypothetical protein
MKPRILACGPDRSRKRHDGATVPRKLGEVRISRMDQALEERQRGD